MALRSLASFCGCLSLLQPQALHFGARAFAAGVAEIVGVEGLQTSDLNGVSWYVRTDGHCGLALRAEAFVVKDAMNQNKKRAPDCSGAPWLVPSPRYFAKLKPTEARG
jgi:hypothetical protein